MSRSKSRRAAKRRVQEQTADNQRPVESRERLGVAVSPTSQPVAPRAGASAAASTAPASTARTPKSTAQDSSDGGPKRSPVLLGTPGAGGVSDEDFAVAAEALMKEYKEQKDFKGLTTTKLRGIYALIMNVYTRASTPEEYERCKSDVQYLKVRMAYEAGRDDAVKDFLTRTHLMRLIDSIGSFEQFLLYCRYAEALVAYFKFYGGKDS